MKIIFMGTPQVAAQCLEGLLSHFPVEVAVTQPDRPRGRGLQVTPSPVKVIAEKEGIEVLQPLKMRDQFFVERLRQIAPDLIVVVAYGGFLTEEVLKIPPLGCVNLHSSLLPKYRGATPVQWAVMKGETETGWTTFYLTKEMDAGDIILQRKISILPDEDAQVLFERMIPTGIQLLQETVQNVLDKKAPRIPQDHGKASLAPKLSKSAGEIDWNIPAHIIFNQVRGLIPWPVAFTYFEWRGKRLELRIFKARVEAHIAEEPGKVLGTDSKGFFVATADGTLWLEKVQMEGSRRMNAQEFLRGHSLPVGAKFGT
ncbi:MAG: methionyl-tRNA formyltransferase [Chlamydiae bacterium]|nr:methionyl-tRNA formyltransferase [Chlamydiota bacterium]MBI3276630.1 methionyl-tRNA formyltransferase [Chlamydiota bacterium]